MIRIAMAIVIVWSSFVRARFFVRASVLRGGGSLGRRGLDFFRRFFSVGLVMSKFLGSS